MKKVFLMFNLSFLSFLFIANSFAGKGTYKAPQMNPPQIDGSLDY